MAKSIFVNMPVTDLPRAIAYYEAIGGVRNPLFSDENAACIVFSETIYAMLLTHEKTREFTTKPIADAREANEMVICLSEESRDAVDDTLERGLAAGGREPRATEDYGFMYSRALEDRDGHVWEFMWMDPKAAAEGPPTAG